VTSLDRLFNPRAILIAGASGEHTRPGGQVARALNEYGYRGAIYPVNPKYQELAGHRCYASVDDVPDACDLAVVALPAAQVPGVIVQCAGRRIPYAVVLGGGFREAGAAGERIEAAMLEAARAGEVRLIGPNCLGLVNVSARVYAAFGGLTRPPMLEAGGVSAVLQSGGVGPALLIRCAQAGVGFRYVVTSGNEADISTAELISAYADDPQTTLILAYIEGVANGRAFMDGCRKALAAGKPVIVLKAGNTTQGRAAAASHTANLTGSHDVFQAAFRQCGVIEVTDMDTAADLALSFAAGRPPRGRGVAVMGGSGGAGALFADAADDHGLILPTPAAATRDILEANLPALSALNNPIDYSSGSPRPEQAAAFQRAFEAVLADPDIHQLGLLFGPVAGERFTLGAQLLAKAAAGSDKPVFVYSVLSRELASQALDVLRAAGIPVLSTPRRMAHAMAALARFAHSRLLTESAHNSVVMPDMAALLPAHAVTLNEVESKAIVAAAGISVSCDVLLPPDEKAVLPRGMRYPVAVKIVSRQIAHKSDVGAVRLNVRDAAALAQAMTDVVESARQARPDAPLDSVLVSEMITDGIETLIGIVNDPVFGPVVVVGLGGVLAEVLRDVSYRIAPFGLDDAHAMIKELRAHTVFDGVRGRPAADVAALAKALVQVSALAWQLRDRIVELDINPLLVRPHGLGVVAADALVVLRAES